MDESRRLRGIELRYALSYYLAPREQCTVADLIDGLTHQGFAFGDHPSKEVSDALRWEVRRGRVIKVSRGTYQAATDWPRTTTHRIRARVLAMRTVARENRLTASELSDDDFWELFN
jgi:hypothetical protein